LKIFQIEPTNHCNAKCSYCPHSKMTREKGFMSIETFDQCMQVIENSYVGLHHFGEPMLHPALSLMIELAAIKNIRVEFSTNGGNWTHVERVMKAQPYMIRYAYDYFKNPQFLKYVTEHNISTIIKTHSVEEGTKPSTNFAGAVNIENKIKGECYFKKYKYVCVLWDGRVVPCCCDYDGQHVIGDVWRGVKHQKTYELCKTCSGMQFTEGGLWEKE